MRSISTEIAVVDHRLYAAVAKIVSVCICHYLISDQVEIVTESVCGFGYVVQLWDGGN